MKRGFLNTDRAKQKLVADTDITPVRQDKGKGKAATPLQNNGSMKRGFLNTDKAKQQLAALAPDSSSTPLKNKGKAVAITTPRDNEPHPYPPLLDLHCVPPSMTAKKGKPNKKRFIFRQWPRDPNGQPILPSDIHGKEAPNGLDFWGATIFDFYFVHRMPDIANALTISTGSKLVKVMQSLGELEHAKEEISWAAREADPEEIPAWDPAEAVVAHERRVHAMPAVDRSIKLPQVSLAVPDADVQMLDVFEQPGHSTVSTEDAVEVEDTSTKDDMSETTDLSVDSTVLPTPQPLLNISMESPFHPTHYPPPWPLVPFESSCSPFPLQRQIPIHLLPKKLYVHDPWGLVDTANARFPNPELLNEQKQESWDFKTDRIRTYALSIPPKLVEAASKAAIAAEAEALKRPEAIFISPQEIEGPTEQPAIRVFLPPRPAKLTEVPEGHLYLSPKGRLGEGNHSVVYEVELELPREIFCESTYCRSCLDDQIKVEVDRLKASGEWDRMLNDTAEEIVVTKAQDTVSDHTPSSIPAQISPHYVGFVKEKFEHFPMETMSIALADHVATENDGDAPAEQLMRVSDSVIRRYIQYEGPVISVHPHIRWQNPSFPDTICAHQTKKLKPVPRTATFRVAAKLSLPYDGHLNREANNYLAFPAHFFQHWSGYNVVPPLHDPTPVGALVPQFFGYYKPELDDDDDDDDASDPEEWNASSFRSPILLVEHCGKPISVEKLSLDDRHECAALLYRFHSAGWKHNSFAARNILRQKHHPTCSPLEDQDKCARVAHRHRPYSFRMIDFGRSTKVKTSSECLTESVDAKTLFCIMEYTHP